MKNFSYVPTEDGSLTLLHQETAEFYHNRIGAEAEARLNYALPAILLTEDKKKISLIDCCFGLGYNTLALLDELQKSGREIEVTVLAIDIDAELVEDSLPRVLAQECFSGLTLTGAFVRDWTTSVSGAVTLHSRYIAGDLRSVLENLDQDTSPNYDLVFHDPFSPHKATHLWTYELFAQYKRLLAPNRGSVLTYSAASAVRGALDQLGFSVWRTTALGGKSGGTLATLSDIEPDGKLVNSLDAEEKKRLTTSSCVPYRDNESMTLESLHQDRAREQKEFLKSRGLR